MFCREIYNAIEREDEVSIESVAKIRKDLKETANKFNYELRGKDYKIKIEAAKNEPQKEPDKIFEQIQKIDIQTINCYDKKQKTQISDKVDKPINTL